jgi:ubiquinone/menaquinone biosynthesis C-methylase UbiE
MMQHSDERKQAVQETFGKNAEKYVQSSTHAKGEDLKLMVEWLQPQRDWTVLDIATGGGHVARALAAEVDLVVATDLTRPMLEAAARANQREQINNILYVEADAERLPFLDAAFDVVTCRIAGHHFPDPGAFIREVSRVLRPEGYFLFIDNVAPEDQELAAFVNQIEKMRDVSHGRCLSVREWATLFAKNRLNPLREKENKKKFAFLEWVKRTSESRKQEEAVEQFILQAADHLRDYLQVQIMDQRVLTHQIDEWMVICKKEGNDGNGSET